jgi:hypothetical protein
VLTPALAGGKLLPIEQPDVPTARKQEEIDMTHFEQQLNRKIKLYGEASGRIEFAAGLLSDLQDVMTPSAIEDDYLRQMLIRRIDTVKGLLFEATDVIDGRNAA